MKPPFRTVFVLLIFTAGLMGCATSQPSRITLRPVRKAPTDPVALAHYIDAKIFEMKGNRTAAVSALRAAVAIDSTSATLYRALADNLTGLKHYTEAVEPARQAVRLAPREVENRRLLYRALMLGPRDTLSAVKQLEAIVRLDASSLQAYDQLLRIYAAQNRRADALRVLDRISGFSILGTQGKFVAAENYMRHNAAQKAKDLYRQVVSENPRQTEAWTRLGRIALTAGDTLEAARTFREALGHFPSNERQIMPLWGQLATIYGGKPHLDRLLAEAPPDTAFLEGLTGVFRSLARQSKTPQSARAWHTRALSLIDHLIPLSPTRDDLLARKGQILLDLDRPDEARDVFREAIKLESSPRYWLSIAHTYRLEGNREKGIRILRSLYEKAPADSRYYPEIVFSLGRAYNAAGRIPDALELYRQASEAKPDELGFRFELGRTYTFEKSWEKAIPIFEALAPEAEENAGFLRDILFQLGQSRERAGRFDDSVKAFQRLITLDPEDHRALNYLGYMYADKNVRLGEAGSLIDRALKAEPQNGAYLDSMGWVHYRKGQYEDAMKYLDRALAVEEAKLDKLGEDDPGRVFLYENLAVIHDHAGDVAHALKDHRKARRHWERALEFDPENESIKEKLNTLVDPVGERPPADQQ